jgi:hypothetical protein
MPHATTTEERLEELGRRIDVLAARTQAGTVSTRVGIQRRVAALRKGRAAARAAVLDAAARVEESMMQLEARVTIAERSAAADIAEDVGTFVETVTEELHGWDVYLERLQVKVATTAGDGRDRAEEAIRELRRHWNALRTRLAGLTSTSGEVWRDVREQLQAARDELELRAAEVEATLAEGNELMAAADEQAALRRVARARLAREILDGAQQQCVTALIDLQLAQEKRSSDPDRSQQLVDLAAAQVESSVETLRKLAATVHPG